MIRRIEIVQTEIYREFVEKRLETIFSEIILFKFYVQRGFFFFI